MSIFSRFIDWIFSFFWKEEMEVTLIGLNNSGKTTFANLISNGNYSEEMTPTIGFSLRRVTKGSVSIKMFDIGGQTRFRSMWARYCRGVDVIVFMLDATTEKSIEKSGEELLSLLNDSHLTGIPMLILGNKNDLPDALDERELVEALNLCSVQNREIGCISISCKNKENIGTSLQWIVNHRRSRL